MEQLQQSRVTVIIPEHKRPDHLRRLLDYFGSSGINIIVTDSSDTVFKYLDEFKDRITYRHYPAAPLAEKLNYILPLISTPYVFMCANDDFIVPASVFRVIDFLETHPDYNSGQGIFTEFTVNGNNIKTSLRYANTKDVDLSYETPVERLFALQRNYFQYYYCVFRTAMFKKVINSVMDNGRAKIRNLCLLESYMSIFTAMEGKHRIIPVFYAARENIFNSAASFTDSIPEIILKKKYHKEYGDYIRLLTLQLASLTNFVPQEAEVLIHDSIKLYVTQIHPDYYAIKGRLKQHFKNVIKQADIFRIKSIYDRYRLVPQPEFSPLALKNGAYWKEIEQYIIKYKFIYNNEL